MYTTTQSEKLSLLSRMPTSGTLSIAEYSDEWPELNGDDLRESGKSSRRVSPYMRIRGQTNRTKP